jgi:hypothetical protein
MQPYAEPGGETHFIDIAQNHLFHALMLKYFTYNTTISTSNYQDIFWIRVAREREMRDHFLVAERRSVSGSITL